MEVQSGSRIESSSDAIALSLATVRQQQDKLQALLEESRESAAALLADQRRLHEESATVASRIAELEAELQRQRNSDLAHEVVSLREQHRSLQQQEARVAERAERLAGLSQRLRVAVRQSEAIGATLTGDGPVQESGGLLANLAWRVAQAQEEERERLAREIHDGPVQALANAIFELEFCERLLEKDPVKLRHELSRLKNDLRQSLGDVRHFIFGLRPAVLSELGLSATLRRYAEDYQTRCGIAVELELDETARLASAQEVAIFRIVQESLQNARKHSRATRVSLRLRAEKDRIVVTIEDNGEGFDLIEATERNTGHFGLRGMQERARLIGAKLEVTSEPGSGTKVTLIVPQELYDERCNP